ncbi:MAG: hypothetical protein ACI9QD_000691 [Thermoproteota archaeon]|jgi:hypothetical protein
MGRRDAAKISKQNSVILNQKRRAHVRVVSVSSIKHVVQKRKNNELTMMSNVVQDCDLQQSKYYWPVLYWPSLYCVTAYLHVSTITIQRT